MPCAFEQTDRFYEVGTSTGFAETAEFFRFASRRPAA
jgi:hypothetical protein